MKRIKVERLIGDKRTKFVVYGAHWKVMAEQRQALK